MNFDSNGKFVTDLIWGLFLTVVLSIVAIALLGGIDQAFWTWNTLPKEGKYSVGGAICLFFALLTMLAGSIRKSRR